MDPDAGSTVLKGVSITGANGHSNTYFSLLTQSILGQYSLAAFGAGIGTVIGRYGLSPRPRGAAYRIPTKNTIVIALSTALNCGLGGLAFFCTANISFHHEIAECL